MYVLVRQDLPIGLQMAQAIHAAVELALTHPVRAKKTPNTVVLSVLDEDDLCGWSERIDEQCLVTDVNVPYKMFREPDLGNEYTALATFSDGKLFSNLPLAGRRQEVPA